MRVRTFSLILAAAVVLAGCSFGGIAERVNPYRIDVRQGNYVDQTMVAQLRRGMTPEQVRFVMGTPLVVDMFRENRWDYVYLFQPGRGQPESRRLSLFFADGVLERVEGDVVGQGEGEAADQPLAPERSRVIEVPAAQR